MAEETDRESWNFNERRSDERKKVTLKRTFSAELDTDTAQNCYIYIVDMSTGGMKIMTDFPLPGKDAFTIKILLEDPMAFRVKQIWQKLIVGYMNTAGLQFVDTTNETVCNARTFMDRFAIETSRKNIRLNRMMPTQIKKDDEWINFYAYVLNLSNQGFEFTSDFDLPLDQPFMLRFFLEPRKAPLETEARVLFRREISMERKKGWLEFCSLSAQNRLRLSEYIGQQIQGDLPVKTAAPLDHFSLDSNGSGSLERSGEGEYGVDNVKKLYSETEEATGPEDRDWMP